MAINTRRGGDAHGGEGQEENDEAGKPLQEEQELGHYASEGSSQEYGGGTLFNPWKWWLFFVYVCAHLVVLCLFAIR